MPVEDNLLVRWIVDSCLDTRNNVNAPAGYHRCQGAASLATCRQLDDLYGAFIKQLRWDVDKLLSVWFGELRMKSRPYAWNVAAGIGGEAYGVMGAGFDLVAVEKSAACEAEFPKVHPKTGAQAKFVCQDLWAWMDQQDLNCCRLPNLVCGGLPCAGYSNVSNIGVPSEMARWVATMRCKLDRMAHKLKTEKNHDMVWWLENVPQAAGDMVHPTCICGAALGLPLFRHRLFDSNFGVQPVVCRHSGMCVSTRSPYRQARSAWFVTRSIKNRPRWVKQGCKCGGNTFQLFGGHFGGNMGSLTDQQRALGMDWGFDAKQLHQCIPPVYGLWMGRFALQHLICARLRSLNGMTF